MKYIYLYTTETYITKNWYKIGETTLEPSKRVQQQDKTSNPEPLILLACWEVTDNINDKDIHLELNNLGFFKLRNNREWFELSKNPKKDIQDILNSMDFIENFVEKTPQIEDIIPIKIENYKDLWWFKKVSPPL
jgi:hypothetical protein